MSKFYAEDQEYTDQFLKIVDANGGEKCRAWAKVARTYFQLTGIKVNQASKLRKKWESLTNFKENFTENQALTFYETGIKSRGNSKEGKDSFQQKTGIKMYQSRYTKKLSAFLLNAVSLFEDLYIHDKKTGYKRLIEKNSKKGRVSYVSVNLMLKAVDIKDCQGDLIFEELKQCGIKLEELLFLYAKMQNQEEKFQAFKDQVSRWKMRRIMFFLDYLNELRRISISYYEKLDILTHPLLKQQIEQNKQTQIYQRLILESDWQSKYVLYNECSSIQAIQENDEFSMLIKQTSNPTKNRKVEKDQIKEDNHTEVANNINLLHNYHIVSKNAHRICNRAAHAEITQPEKQRLRTFRGNDSKHGQVKSRGWTTIVFDHDMSSNDIDEDQENSAEREQYFQKMQELFECTFGREQQKKSKKQKKTQEKSSDIMQKNIN